MALKEGERVRIVTREVTADDRKEGRYYAHMGGNVGVIQRIFSEEEVVIVVDAETVAEPAKSVMEAATKRLNQKFAENATEEAKSKLTPEELKFPVNYVVLVQSSDLEKI